MVIAGTAGFAKGVGARWKDGGRDGGGRDGSGGDRVRAPVVFGAAVFALCLFVALPAGRTDEGVWRFSVDLFRVDGIALTG